MTPTEYDSLPCGHRDPTEHEAITGFGLCHRLQAWPSPDFCRGCRTRNPAADRRSGSSLERGLLDLFARRPRIVVEGTGVLTACDRAAFPALQFLYYSIWLSHDVPFRVIDLGLAPEQRSWCARRPGLEVVACPGPLLMPRTEPMWQTWNKPLWLKHSGFRRTIWLDADTVVRGDLRGLLSELDRGPVTVRDSTSTDICLNRPALYDLHPVERRMTEGLPNAGVLGVVAGRDDALVDDWAACVLAAAKSPVAREALAWWDQGALHWAMEQAGLTCSSVDDQGWNSLQRAAPCANPEEVLELIGRGAGQILHFAGGPKPWSGWADPIPIELEGALATRLKCYVLGHEEWRLAAVPRRAYFEPVHLDDLGPGPWQRNEMSEIRIFLSDAVRDDREYLGLCTARWDDKYVPSWFPDRLRLREFDFLRPNLEPGVVLAADPVLIDWVQHSEQAHPGMLPLLEEMARISRLRLHTGPTLASNNFIAHRSVFLGLRAFVREMFGHFHRRYGWDLPFSVGDFDPARRAAYFYERASMLYFANRPDLTIRPLTYPALWDRPAPPETAPPRLSVLIATTGRPTLARTLRSIRQQALRPGDEVLIVGDGPQPEARAMWEEADLPGRYLEYPDGPSGDWGHTPRNWGMPQARGDYLLHMDDDDIYLPRAFETIRAALAERPGRPHLFRMIMPAAGGLMWDRPEVTYGNVSTQLIVHPARPGTYGRWASRYGGDHDFIKQTLGLWPPGSLVWSEAVIAHYRPD